MNGSLDYYKVFYVVAKYNSMTKASEKLLISQPAISKTIRNLENQIGGTLFNRSPKGITLNEEGKMLFERIKPALELIHNAESEFMEFQKLNKGEIKIGISSVLTKCLLLDVLSVFQLRYPNVKITILNGLTSDLIENLKDGLLDFVVYNESNIEEKSVEINHLAYLDYVFCYNPLFFDVNVKNLEDLNNYPLILQNKSSNTRKYLDELTNNKLIPYMEVISQDLICNLVNVGLGIGFVFNRIVNMINPNLKKISFNEVSKCNVYIAKNKNLTPSFATKAFIKELIKNRS